MTMILSILNRFKNLSKIPPHLAYVATLPCERLMSAKQAKQNDKLQGSVATCLWCGGVINNQIKKSLFLSHEWKKLFKSVNIWPSYKQDRDCFVHFLRLLAVCWPSAYVYQRKGFFLIVQVVPWYSWPFAVFFCFIFKWWNVRRAVWLFIRNGENTMFASSEVFPFRTHAGVASPVVNTKMALCVYDRNTLLSLLLITVESFEWYLMFIVSVVMPCGVCACCFRSASSKRRSWP